MIAPGFIKLTDENNVPIYARAGAIVGVSASIRPKLTEVVIVDGDGLYYNAQESVDEVMDAIAKAQQHDFTDGMETK